MMRALVFSGGGDYSDPWHPYAESSDQLAELLRAWGVDVEVTDRVSSALDALADDPDLFVVNAGAGPEPHPSDGELAAAAIGHVEAGGTLLVVHLSTGLFPGDDAWEETIGARWIWDDGTPDASGHPPHGPFTVQLDGGGEFTIVDESYARLRPHAGSRVLAWHENDPDAVRHPLVWVRPRGTGTVVVDLLGHDGASFLTEGHGALLRRALQL
jgi:hypothetical protein